MFDKIFNLYIPLFALLILIIMGILLIIKLQKNRGYVIIESQLSFWYWKVVTPIMIFLSFPILPGFFSASADFSKAALTVSSMENLRVYEILNIYSVNLLVLFFTYFIYFFFVIYCAYWSSKLWTQSFKKGMKIKAFKKKIMFFSVGIAMIPIILLLPYELLDIIQTMVTPILAIIGFFILRDTTDSKREQEK